MPRTRLTPETITKLLQTGANRLTTARAAAKFAVQERDGKMPLLTGYAMVWGTLSDDRGGYKVRLAPMSAQPAAKGAFALCNHDFSQVLASTAAGTLTCTADAYGLKVEIDPADTSYGRDMCALIRRGDVGGMSFSMLHDGSEYKIITPAEEDDEDDEIVEYSKFTFDEVTITAIPAFADTTITSEFTRPTAAPAGSPAAPPAPTPLRNLASLALQEMDLPFPK